MLSPNSLTFNGTGSSLNQTSTVTENDYFGSFTESSTNCSGIATISPTTVADSGGQFTVTPVAAGTCSYTVTDLNGMTTTLSITVTTTNVTVNGSKRTSTPVVAPQPEPAPAPTLAPVTNTSPHAAPGIPSPRTQGPHH